MEIIVQKNPLKLVSSLLLLTLALFSTTSCSAEDNVWEFFQILIGLWEGEGSGFGQVSEVTHQWDFMLNDTFLRLQTQSITQRKDGLEEIHEDVGFISYDRDHDEYVFRQFLSEGFVNTYDVTMEQGDTLLFVFDHREAESAGGMKARMYMNFKTEDNYHMVLELAGSGQK